MTVLVLVLALGVSIWGTDAGRATVPAGPGNDVSAVCSGPNEFYAAPSQINVSPSWTHDSGKNLYIRPVAISGDGSTVIEGSDTLVSLFDAHSGTLLWTHDVGGMVFDAEISRDGNTSVVGANTTQVVTFQRSTDVPLWTANCSDWVATVDVSADGSVIAAGDTSGMIYLFHRDSNQPVWTFNATESVFFLDLSSDGSTLVAASRNYTVSDTIYLFDTTSNNTLWTFSASDAFFEVSVSAEGELIAVAANDALYVFSRNSNATVWKYGGDGFWSLDVSENGDTIVAGRWRRDTESVYVWHSDSNETVWRFRTSYEIPDVATSEDGREIVVGCMDNVTRVFSVTSNETVLQYTSSGEVNAVSVSESGDVFVVSSAGGQTHLFELSEPQAGSVSPTRTAYGTSEQVDLTAQVNPGTAPISAGLVLYSTDNSTWSTAVMQNATSLSSSPVVFNVSIGPFSEGRIYLHTWFNDTLGFVDEGQTIHVDIDGTPPELLSLTYEPQTPTSEDAVLVNVSVDDAVSGVAAVTLRYSVDGGNDWSEVAMVSSSGSSYTGTIPPQPNSTVVLFYIVAVDGVGNEITLDNHGDYFSYTVLDYSATTTTTGTSTTSGSTTGPSGSQPGQALSIVFVGLAVLAAAGVAGSFLFLIYLRRERLGGPSPSQNV